FYWMQLPNLRTRTLNWPVLRESQAVALSLPNTGMVPTIDIGDDNDLHPKNKRPMAERMADLVLAEQYGKPTWPGCPVYEQSQVEGETIRLTFGNTGAQLRTSDGEAPRSFALAGED